MTRENFSSDNKTYKITAVFAPDPAYCSLINRLAARHMKSISSVLPLRFHRFLPERMRISRSVTVNGMTNMLSRVSLFNNAFWRAHGNKKGSALMHSPIIAFSYRVCQLLKRGNFICRPVIVAARGQRIEIVQERFAPV